MLPFTPEQFLAVFVGYNADIWPLQVAFYLVGSAALTMVFWRTVISDYVAAASLSAMWLWTGLVYHGVYFAQISTAAYLFAALFVAQGAYLAVLGIRNRIGFEFRPGPTAWFGVTFVAYATLIYPLVGVWAGHPYPEMPMFGVTPCPVTIFTFGMFMLTTRPLPRGLLVIPFVWSLIGGSAALLLHVPQDWFLLISGFVAIAHIILRDRAKASAMPAG